MFTHSDSLSTLNSERSLKDKLRCVHQNLQKSLPFIARIAVAIYDPQTGLLKTYLHSSGDEDPLSNYQARLDDVPSLKEILQKNRPRVVNNMVTFESSTSTHAKRIGRSGYAASYTMPMFYDGVFFGFVFFNSMQTDVFGEETLHMIDPYGHMISLMMINELNAVRTLAAAVKTTQHITHVRDPETGSHLDRMSRYSRLIASQLANQYELNDSYIEHIFMFSPLHDIGKVGIPDEILLKPGPLDEQERTVMKSHSRKGREMIDDLVTNFALGSFENVGILRNIAEYHHEAVDGSGYPDGKREQEIPLEARIVAVADVFDALTSRRPYKQAWSNAQAFAWLQEQAGHKLDRDCVAALMARREEVEAIQLRFQEDSLG